jgi:hypothetical protein
MELAHPEAPKVDDNSALAQLDAEEKLLDDAAKAARLYEAVWVSDLDGGTALNEALAACQGKDH